MSAHTPGPWEMVASTRMSIEGNVHKVFNGDKFPTAFVPAWNEPGPNEIDGTEEALANARLIAAAPDLLAALETLLRPYGAVEVGCHRADASVQSDFYDAARHARAVIAKAKGETT